MTFVVSQNQLTGLSAGRVRVASSLAITEGYTADYASIWTTHGSVRTVVGFIARNVASIGLQVFERMSDNDRRRDTDSAVAKLLARPAPNVTRYRFMESLVSDLCIFDRYLAIKDKGGALWRVPPGMFTPVAGDWLAPEGYKVQGSKGYKVFKPEEVVAIQGYSPAGEFGGTSILEGLRSMLAEEYEAARMRQKMFRNGARTTGYLERPPNTPWSDPARDRFREGWREQYGAGGSDEFGTPILEDGMKYVPASQTAKDLQYVEARKLTREEVAAAYFIPPPMVGLLDHATFSNIKEQHKQLYQDTLGPWLDLIEQELRVQVIEDMAPGSNLYAEFNLESKLRGSFDEQAQQFQAAVGGPYMTRNEARSMSNLPAIDGGDELITPLNVLTGGQASPQDSGSQNLGKAARGPLVKAAAPQEQHADHLAKVLADYFARQREEVLPALTGTKAAAPSWWDAERYDEELTQILLDEALTITPAVAAKVLGKLGLDAEAYDVDRTVKFLTEVSSRIASSMNTTTAAALAAAFEEDDTASAVENVFDVAEDARASQAGMTLATTFVGFATREAAHQQAPNARKRWQVNSSNPRASHAAMNGEEVGLDEDFSNGLPWPGSFSTDVEEVAGCTCSIVIVT